ncbi:hypothetical protein SO802_012480 [Lithocarpus litseifolius]|uniref:Uncharacterized protein n=1 Tax=Lithocarpus litseifolius TaxID=425828 RepID=A0AAW2D3P1_9ROSI
MVTPINDETAQRIFKAMEEQSNVLKKMGSCLNKLEEAKLKKATHVEIPNDKDGEGWDKRDKPITKGINNLRSSPWKPWP